MKRTLWISTIAVALLSLTCFAFAQIDTHDTTKGQLGTPNVSYSSVYGADYNDTGYVYDFATYGWVGGTSTPNGSELIDVSCDVEMWLNFHLGAHQVYFHKADITSNMEAVISGSLQSNNGQWLFVTAPLCPTNEPASSQEVLSNLHFVGNQLNNPDTPTSGVSADIPLNWYLADDNAVAGPIGPYSLMTWSGAGNNGRTEGFTYRLAGGQAGMINFRIKAQILPDAYQADGKYRMDPVIAVAPAL